MRIFVLHLYIYKQSVASSNHSKANTFLFSLTCKNLMAVPTYLEADIFCIYLATLQCNPTSRPHFAIPLNYHSQQPQLATPLDHTTWRPHFIQRRVLLRYRYLQLQALRTSLQVGPTGYTDWGPKPKASDSQYSDRKSSIHIRWGNQSAIGPEYRLLGKMHLNVGVSFQRLEKAVC